MIIPNEYAELGAQQKAKSSKTKTFFRKSIVCTATVSAVSDSKWLESGWFVARSARSG